MGGAQGGLHQLNARVQMEAISHGARSAKEVRRRPGYVQPRPHVAERSSAVLRWLTTYSMSDVGIFV